MYIVHCTYTRQHGRTAGVNEDLIRHRFQSHYSAVFFELHELAVTNRQSPRKADETERMATKSHLRQATELRRVQSDGPWVLPGIRVELN